MPQLCMGTICFGKGHFDPLFTKNDPKNITHFCALSNISVNDFLKSILDHFHNPECIFIKKMHQCHPFSNSRLISCPYITASNNKHFLSVCSTFVNSTSKPNIVFGWVRPF